MARRLALVALIGLAAALGAHGASVEPQSVQWVGNDPNTGACQEPWQQCQANSACRAVLSCYGPCKLLPLWSGPALRCMQACRTRGLLLTVYQLYDTCLAVNDATTVHVRVDTVISAPPAAVYGVISAPGQAGKWSGGGWTVQPLPHKVGDQFRIFLQIGLPFRIPFPLPAVLRDVEFDSVTGEGAYGWSGGQVSPQGDALISWHHYFTLEPTTDADGNPATLLKHAEDASGFYIPFISWNVFATLEKNYQRCNEAVARTLGVKAKTLSTSNYRLAVQQHARP